MLEENVDLDAKAELMRLAYWDVLFVADFAVGEDGFYQHGIYRKVVEASTAEKAVEKFDRWISNCPGFVMLELRGAVPSEDGGPMDVA